jgi:hypothetical protein
MIGWGTIAYGAVLSALLAAFGVFVFGGERRGRGALVAGLCTGLAAGGWNAVLHVTEARALFTEAPLAAFPISWQDGGSGVCAYAATTLALGTGSRRSARAVQVVFLGVLCGLAALLVSIYLY